MALSDFKVGHEFSVTIDGVAYPFKTVSVHPTVNMVNRANSKYAPGFAVRKAGMKSMEVTAEGPYNSSEITLIIGGEYALTVRRFATHAGTTEGFILADYTWNADQESGESNVSVTFQSKEGFLTTFQ